MNKKQLLVMWATIGIVVAMLLFPPWKAYIGGEDYFRTSYGFLFNLPSDTISATLDLPRLFLQILIALFIGGGFFITLGKRNQS